MKNKIKHIAAVTLTGSIMFFPSCTGSFENYNTDPTAISDSLQLIDCSNLRIPMSINQQGVYFNYDWGSGKNWPYQIMQSLSMDTFSGYMHDCTPFNGGTNNSDYNLMDNWNASFWQNTYSYIAPSVLKLEEKSVKDNPGFYGVTKILKVELMHRVSDIYGPIIYTNFGDSKTGSMPDSQKKAYYAFFADLDLAISKLDQRIKENPAAYSIEVGRVDFLTGPSGSYQQWIKFANSLRLRLAIRIASIDQTKGKEEALKALSNKYGVFEDVDDIIAVSTTKGYTNPVGEINRSWNELNMNANMESILNGYQDPRMKKFFEPAANTKCPENDRYRGIRQGTCFTESDYRNNSKPAISQNTDAILMTAAEVWFLRAEAALRGWTSESVSENYKSGIETSFAQWKVKGSAAYLASDNVARDFVDLIDPTNNITAVCKVSPKWDDSATNEVKLEKIITQKWIAIYPEGCEAWAEQRRTGYPRLFPVKKNNSGGKIDTKIMIRRLNFPTDIIKGAADQYAKLTEYLGGPDTGGTRLWWDTGKNF